MINVFRGNILKWTTGESVANAVLIYVRLSVSVSIIAFRYSPPAKQILSSPPDDAYFLLKVVIWWKCFTFDNGWAKPEIMSARKKISY